MREIRPYGSARGVRSNPYPYRDPPPPDDAVGGALLTLPRNTLRDHHNVTPAGSGGSASKGKTQPGHLVRNQRAKPMGTARSSRLSKPIQSP